MTLTACFLLALALGAALESRRGSRALAFAAASDLLLTLAVAVVVASTLSAVPAVVALWVVASFGAAGLLVTASTVGGRAGRPLDVRLGAPRKAPIRGAARTR